MYKLYYSKMHLCTNFLFSVQTLLCENTQKFHQQCIYSSTYVNIRFNK